MHSDLCGAEGGATRLGPRGFREPADRPAAKSECPRRDRNNRHPACPKLPQPRIESPQLCGGARGRTLQHPNRDCPGHGVEGFVAPGDRAVTTTRVPACPNRPSAATSARDCGGVERADAGPRLEWWDLSDPNHRILHALPSWVRASIRPPTVEAFTSKILDRSVPGLIKLQKRVTSFNFEYRP